MRHGIFQEGKPIGLGDQPGYPVGRVRLPMIPVIVFLHVFNVSESSAMLPMRGLPSISFTVTKLLIAAAFQFRAELAPSYFYKI